MCGISRGLSASRVCRSTCSRSFGLHPEWIPCAGACQVLRKLKTQELSLDDPRWSSSAATPMLAGGAAIPDKYVDVPANFSNIWARVSEGRRASVPFTKS